MKQIIKDVLSEMGQQQINLSSETAQETLAILITSALKSKGTYTLDNENNSAEKSSYINEGFDTYSPYNNQNKKDWPGLDNIISRKELVEQAYREVTADGLPQGGDVEAMKLAEAIVDGLKEGDYIYESPDGGGTVFRRKFQDYDSNNKEEIDWETKEPTGRKFKDYNNGNWNEDINKK